MNTHVIISKLKALIGCALLVCVAYFGCCFHQALASTGVEILMGATCPSGGSLSWSPGFGGQANLIFGGRPTILPNGSAVYGYGGLSLDRINSFGPTELGDPPITRDQLSVLFGVRYLHPIFERVRISFDLGTGYLWDQSAVEIISGVRTQFKSETWIYQLGIGGQFLLTPGLALSFGYSGVFYHEGEATSVIERALVNQNELSTGKTRFQLGFSWIY